MNMPISRYLDHAVLKPEMSQQEAREAIELGVKHEVKTVCVRPCDIPLATGLCAGSETEVCCVLGFPHGDVPASVKAEEARQYVALGVREIDMVANYGYIRSQAWDWVKQDITAVAAVTRPADVVLKVIFETAMLTLDEVTRATEICIACGADFVKTSTGFNGEGATEEVVRTMLAASAGRIKIKASGGVRDFARAKMFVDMGCARIGVGYGSTAAICNGSGATSSEVY